MDDGNSTDGAAARDLGDQKRLTPSSVDKFDRVKK